MTDQLFTILLLQCFLYMGIDAANLLQQGLCTVSFGMVDKDVRWQRLAKFA